MKKNIISLLVVILVSVFMLSGCLPGDGTATLKNPAGFFWGIWHGWIAPVSLVWGLFDHSVRIYEQVNSGWWYDLGFYIAAIGGFGSLSLFRKQEKKN
jgi:hypothetical protein